MCVCALVESNWLCLFKLFFFCNFGCCYLCLLSFLTVVGFLCKAFLQFNTAHSIEIETNAFFRTKFFFLHYFGVSPRFSFSIRVQTVWFSRHTYTLIHATAQWGLACVSVNMCVCACEWESKVYSKWNFQCAPVACTIVYEVGILCIGCSL